MSKKLEAQRSMQPRAAVARVEGKIFDSDFEGLKRSAAEETFQIEAQIAELERKKSTFEDLTKQANAQVLNLAQAWIKAGSREQQELQWALFPGSISCDPQKRFFAPANVHLVQLLHELFDSLRQDGVPNRHLFKVSDSSKTLAFKNLSEARFFRGRVRHPLLVAQPFVRRFGCLPRVHAMKYRKGLISRGGSTTRTPAIAARSQKQRE